MPRVKEAPKNPLGTAAILMDDYKVAWYLDLLEKGGFDYRASPRPAIGKNLTLLEVFYKDASEFEKLKSLMTSPHNRNLQ